MVDVDDGPLLPKDVDPPNGYREEHEEANSEKHVEEPGRDHSAGAGCAHYF